VPRNEKTRLINIAVNQPGSIAYASLPRVKVTALLISLFNYLDAANINPCYVSRRNLYLDFIIPVIFYISKFLKYVDQSLLKFSVILPYEVRFHILFIHRYHMIAALFTK